MKPFERLGAALDSLWAAIDPDEPVFCDCQPAFTCPDCTLGAPVDTTPDWGTSTTAVA